LEEKGERRIGGHQLVRGGPVIQTQSDAQRLAVHRAQPLKSLEEWVENLVEPCEAHVGLELRASSTQHPGAGSRRMRRSDVQQHRLADTGIP
jgi:hypothetical protein